MAKFEDHMNIRIEHSAKTLRSKAEMLKQNMERLIKNIDGGNLSAINTLGEVQGLFHIIINYEKGDVFE